MPDAPSRSILFLSHQGGGIVDDLLGVAEACNLTPYFLASASPTRPERVEGLRDRCAGLYVAESPYLTWADVERTLASLADANATPVACMTVWDGYRALMARANAALGATDLAPETCTLVMDKQRMRDRLRAVGLSTARSFTVENEADLEHVKSLGVPMFLKPRVGVGSFAASRLRPTLTWSEFQAARAELTSDPDYAGFFADDAPFVCEDYIPGQEFSVEIIARDATPYVLTIHEKVGLEETGGVVVETMFRSPPALTARERDDLDRVLTGMFSELELTTGCFHVELRLDRGTGAWDVIEINARVGGSYVPQSVESGTGSNILELWFHTLAGDATPLAPSLSQGTFFRIFFGERGRVVDTIGWRTVGPTPSLRHVFVASATELADSGREIPIAHALWTFSLDESGAEVAEWLSRESATALEISYAPNA